MLKKIISKYRTGSVAPQLVEDEEYDYQSGVDNADGSGQGWGDGFGYGHGDGYGIKGNGDA